MKGKKIKPNLETAKAVFRAFLDEIEKMKDIRWCATEALAIGDGGVTLVHEATKVSRSTIIVGQLQDGKIAVKPLFGDVLSRS